MKDLAQANIGKFADPTLTAKGEDRATVALNNPRPCGLTPERFAILNA